MGPDSQPEIHLGRMPPGTPEETRPGMRQDGHTGHPGGGEAVQCSRC